MKPAMKKHPIRADKTPFRSGLLILQAVIAATLFLGAIAVYKQLRSIQQADKGAETRGVLVLNAPDSRDIHFSNL